MSLSNYAQQNIVGYNHSSMLHYTCLWYQNPCICSPKSWSSKEQDHKWAWDSATFLAYEMNYLCSYIYKEIRFVSVHQPRILSIASNLMLSGSLVFASGRHDKKRENFIYPYIWVDNMLRSHFSITGPNLKTNACVLLLSIRLSVWSWGFALIFYAVCLEKKGSQKFKHEGHRNQYWIIDTPITYIWNNLPVSFDFPHS